jgi:hypothetical protein
VFRQYALSVILLTIVLVLSLSVWSSLATRTRGGTLVPDYPGRCVPAKMAGPWQEGRLSIDLAHHQMVYEQGLPSGASASWGKPLC